MMTPPSSMLDPGLVELAIPGRTLLTGRLFSAFLADFGKNADPVILVTSLDKFSLALEPPLL